VVIIVINDSFRVKSVRTGHWHHPVYFVEEWQPSSTEGHWKAITKRFNFEGMRTYLQRHDAPDSALAAFEASRE
jgi:hypothetical protein